MRIVAARGETIGLQVWRRVAARDAVTMAVDGARVDAYAVDAVRVARPSTAMYGGSRGAGEYPDGLIAAAAAAPTTNPAYFEITAEHSGQGELVVGGRRIPVALDVVPVEMPALPLSVWAYYDASELGGTNDAPSAAERACIAMFRARGVLLSPDLPASAYGARRELLAGATFVPALVDANDVAGSVRAWLAAVEGSGQTPFAIPIDEPHDAAARAKVVAMGEQIHAAAGDGAGGSRFAMAVTDERRAEYGSAVDIFISLRARAGDWTYNGAPPRAGSMVVDGESPGLRTWGWIAWRWKIPVWYVWDALYWHDRHNTHGAPRPGRALDAARDAVSFDDGDDHGNLDGVLALRGDAAAPCRPTLRLAALRRGLEDRALVELAAKCAPEDTAALVAKIVPRALGDAAEHGEPAWPRDEAAWEAARGRLLELAASCAR